LTSLIKKRGETSKTSFRFNNEPGKLEKFDLWALLHVMSEIQIGIFAKSVFLIPIMQKIEDMVNLLTL
jgi:hypothetical protein